MKLDGALTRRADGGFTVAFDRTIDRPVAKVWAALTDPAILKNWLGDVDIEPKVGGKFILRFRESKAVMTGTITAFEKERLIEYTWLENFGIPQSLVRWELSPHSRGCRLRLTHTTTPEAAVSDVVGFLGGWHDFLDSLPGAVDGKFMPYGNKPSEKEIDAGYRVKYPEIYKAVPSRVLSVNFERHLPGPIERVWEFLTDTKHLPQWFGADSSIEPRVGGAVSLMGGHIRGTVTQWAPPHRLSYTWNVLAPGETVSAYSESYLSFVLAKRGDGVVLTLTHLPILDRFEKQNAMGWHTFLDILGAHLRGEAIQERAVYMKKNAALYGVDMNNLTR